MIIGFSKHFGKGGSAPVLDYLTGYMLKSETRSIKPQIVRGDREAVARLIDAVPFERKYTSGVLAFHPEDRVAAEAQEDIMNRFENAAFAGLEPDRRSIIWIRHLDKGRLELHFVAPRCDLGTGKSLNIAPPTPASRQLFDTLRSAINRRYSLRDPGDPACAQAVSIPSHVAKLAAQAKRLGRSAKPDIRQAITDRVLAQVQAGRITSRAEVVSFLKAEGFSTTREGVNYVTVECPDTGEKVRLKGEVFREHFRPEDLVRTGRRKDPGQLVRLERQLEQLVEKRATYHRARYKVAEDAVEPGQSKEELTHDRARNPLAAKRPAHGEIAPGARAPACGDALRFNDAAQEFRNASHNLECAGQRVGQVHRAFARDFEATVVDLGRANDAADLVRRYGLAPQRGRDAHELELEIEI